MDLQFIRQIYILLYKSLHLQYQTYLYRLLKIKVTRIKNESNMNQFRFSRVIQN